jgi:hypothetical protein
MATHNAVSAVSAVSDSGSVPNRPFRGSALRAAGRGRESGAQLRASRARGAGGAETNAQCDDVAPSVARDAPKGAHVAGDARGGAGPPVARQPRHSATGAGEQIAQRAAGGCVIVCPACKPHAAAARRRRRRWQQQQRQQERKAASPARPVSLAGPAQRARKAVRRRRGAAHRPPRGAACKMCDGRQRELPARLPGGGRCRRGALPPARAAGLRHARRRTPAAAPRPQLCAVALRQRAAAVRDTFGVAGASAPRRLVRRAPPGPPRRPPRARGAAAAGSPTRRGAADRDDGGRERRHVPTHAQFGLMQQPCSHAKTERPLLNHTHTHSSRRTR